ncbi:MAG: diadenylate cyclase [Candidatus Cloacimonetes bacterium]|jgi:diadenylate cyclase|nr:diadenylate cyclase [Candidatus Cloacimonadota bacterium]MBT6994163.1 diadenylate cyclase [Candidatus Cloacimonadota bacterium]MBT7470059.1 diadenylate cyclase [Candidatus Cloacimonadota bacterium]
MNIFIPTFADILDIVIIALILYASILVLRKYGGYQILIALALIFVFYVLVTLLDLKMVSSVLKVFKDYWIILFIILFQQEIRSLFTKFAHNKNLKFIFSSASKSTYSLLLNAVSIMSFRKIGALIIIENERKLSEFIESGEVIDANISVKLLLTIFNNKTILHDGAVVIRGNRINAVKVVLPLSENLEFTQKFGTRHLAAIGITETTDAVGIVVSEESGKISFVKKGEITTDISIDELAQIIKDETR